jgi:hypothetical protein
MTEAADVVLGRIDERLKAVERDIQEIKNRRTPLSAIWPSVVATAALVITLITLIR